MITWVLYMACTPGILQILNFKIETFHVKYPGTLKFRQIFQGGTVHRGDTVARGILINCTVRFVKLYCTINFAKKFVQYSTVLYKCCTVLYENVRKAKKSVQYSLIGSRD